MKTNLAAINKEEFRILSHKIGNEEVYLITPNGISTVWTSENLIYRSSVWDKDGNLISAGFKKFFNFGENPGLESININNTNFQAVEKLDGSCLIVTRWKNNWIIRTRGCMTPELMEGGNEIAFFKSKYPRVFDENDATWDYSLIFEWVSSRRRIILSYPETELYLIGLIHHDDYSYCAQDVLIEIARVLEVKSPNLYKFDKLSDLISGISSWKDKEGVCIYYNKGQSIRKVKSEWYLGLHRLKSQLSSINNLIEVFYQSNEPELSAWKAEIAATFDFEVLKTVEKDMQAVCNTNKLLNDLLFEIKNEAESWKKMSRKEAAIKIIQQYSEHKSLAFNILDGKPIISEQKQKYLKKVIDVGGKSVNLIS